MVITKSRRHAIAAISGLGLVLALAACSTAQIMSEQPISAAVEDRPDVVYVADFELPADAVRAQGLFANSPRHVQKEQRQAHTLVELMSNTIVKDLRKKGLQASRLPPGTQLPLRGWLVRGSFVQVNEGNRVGRALIGFGAGHTDLQIAVGVDELAANRAPAPLYTVEAAARSGKSPGAVITLNPFAAAFKFVMSGNDLNHDAEHSAAKIADDVVAHVSATPRV